MLYRLEKLIGLPVRASDGEIGKITDLYFDDHRWTVRYLILDTGGWLAGRKVLVATASVGTLDWSGNSVHIALTKSQVENSPNIETDKPVSRQHEVDFCDYYAYPYYWSPLIWGSGPLPSPFSPHDAASVTACPAGDPNLRSINEVIGYHLQTTTDSLGHIEGFVLDPIDWTIRYVVVDTHNWWPGKHIVIPPQWITQMIWAERTVHVNVSRATVRSSPEFDWSKDFTRSYETALYEHYATPGHRQ